MGDVLDVDTARRDVRSDENAHRTTGKALERRLASILALIAVDGCSLVPVDGQILGDAVGTMLGAREDNDAIHAFLLIGEQVVEHAALGLGAGHDHPLVDLDHGGALRRGLDLDRLLEERLGQVFDLGRHGGGEQHGLATQADLLGNGAHRGDEAHVEHAVGFVQHQPARFVEADLVVVHQVLEATRRGHDHVDALGDLADLVVARHATEHQHGVELHLGAGEFAQVLFDLHGQFTGGGKNERAGGHRPRTAGKAHDPGQDRQAESRRLARTGLGDAQHVPAFEQFGDRLGLDFSGLGEAAGSQAVGEKGRQAERNEIVQSFRLSCCAKPRRRLSRDAAGAYWNMQSGDREISRGCWLKPGPF